MSVDGGPSLKNANDSLAVARSKFGPAAAVSVRSFERGTTYAVGIIRFGALFDPLGEGLTWEEAMAEAEQSWAARARGSRIKSLP